MVEASKVLLVHRSTIIVAMISMIIKMVVQPSLLGVRSSVR